MSKDREGTRISPEEYQNSTGTLGKRKDCEQGYEKLSRVCVVVAVLMANRGKELETCRERGGNCKCSVGCSCPREGRLNDSSESTHTRRENTTLTQLIRWGDSLVATKNRSYRRNERSPALYFNFRMGSTLSTNLVIRLRFCYHAPLLLHAS